VRNKTAVPEKVANAPSLLPGLDFFYTAFLQLCTCRAIGFSVGPIPWTAVSEYARRHQLIDDDFETFAVVLKRLDSVYLDHQDKKRQKDQKK
jgi:hypothetical protein